jgi:hypothetical protein
VASVSAAGATAELRLSEMASIEVVESLTAALTTVLEETATAPGPLEAAATAI